MTKTTTLEAYFDTIKQLSYKSAAAGAPVSEDLMFYTMHGLPTEFHSTCCLLHKQVLVVRSSLNTVPILW